MKYIKKFESNSVDWNIETIQECFIEFYDNGSLKIGEFDDCYLIGLFIDINFSDNEGSIEHMLKTTSEKNEIIEKVSNCLQKLLFEFSELYYYIKFYAEGNNNHLKITISKTKKEYLPYKL